MPCAVMLAWLKKMRPKWSRSGKTSAWCGRFGAAACRPDRRRAACSAGRSPARAGASSPSSDNRRRPSPSRHWRRSSPRGPRPGRCPRSRRRPAMLVRRRRPLAASWPISRKGEPGSSRRSTRSRGSSLPRATRFSRAFSRAAAVSLRDVGARALASAIVRGRRGIRAGQCRRMRRERDRSMLCPDRHPGLVSASVFDRRHRRQWADDAEQVQQ